MLDKSIVSLGLAAALVAVLMSQPAKAAPVGAVVAAGVAGVVVGAGSAFAQADVMKACGAEWQATKDAKKVKPGETWKSFLAECRTRQAAAKPAAAAPAAAGAAVFPTAVAAKYASETPGKQRMHTCLDQYKANKATNANGGLKWIQKGGGYYSECNKKLGGGAND